MNRILIVEDEKDIHELTAYNLKQEGYRVISAFSGEDGLERAVSEKPNLILLDIMLPVMNGLDVCRELKSNEKTVLIPVIMLTAKNEDIDIISGLELGADDYITKPFSPRVLIARIRVILRRGQKSTKADSSVINLADLSIDENRHEVILDKKPIYLTLTEFQILLILARRPGRVFSRAQLIDELREGHHVISDRAKDVQITNLRKKLENIRRDFVANVSHELKTPLTTILGSAETLLETTSQKPEDHKKFLDMIVRHSQRLNSLVDDLLAMARLEGEIDDGTLRLSRHKLADIITSSITLCRAKSEASGIYIKCQCESSIEANINSSQLEQAIINLIDNAIKYSEPGDTINVKATVENSEVIISVEDRGCGIESKYLPRLFGRFYRVDTGRSRERGGAGLGLAIVKHVALAHGGEVSVDSIFKKREYIQNSSPFDSFAYRKRPKSFVMFISVKLHKNDFPLIGSKQFRCFLG